MSVTARVRRREIARRQTLLLYDLEEDAAEAYQQLWNSLARLSHCERLWVEDYVVEAAEDWKLHAGADTLANREPASVIAGPPDGVVTNVSVGGLRVGKQLLYFLPDLVLIEQDDEWRVGRRYFSQGSMARLRVREAEAVVATPPEVALTQEAA